MTKNTYKRLGIPLQNGATMIEVLVAILIFSIGLLGVATTQTMGLTTTQSALHRSYAAHLSYELIDIIRSNPTASEDGVFDSISIDNTDSTLSYTATNACDSETSNCTTTEMATALLADWETSIDDLLPGSKATVVSTDSESFQLTISWPDFRNNSDRPDSDGDGEIDDVSLITDFRI
jgi:type IV pilus assembly protein PilV